MAESLQFIIKIANTLDAVVYFESITDGQLIKPTSMNSSKFYMNAAIVYSVPNNILCFDRCVSLVYTNIVNNCSSNNTLTTEFPTSLDFDKDWTNYILHVANIKSNAIVLTISGNNKINAANKELFKEVFITLNESKSVSQIVLSLYGYRINMLGIDISQQIDSNSATLKEISETTGNAVNRRIKYQTSVKSNKEELMKQLAITSLSSILEDSSIGESIQLLNGLKRSAFRYIVKSADNGHGFADNSCIHLHNILYSELPIYSKDHHIRNSDGVLVSGWEDKECLPISWTNIPSEQFDNTVNALVTILNHIIGLYTDKNYQLVHLFNELIIHLIINGPISSFDKYIGDNKTIGVKQFHGICLLIYTLAYILKDDPCRLQTELANSSIIEKISSIINRSNTFANIYNQNIILIGLVKQLPLLTDEAEKQKLDEARIHIINTVFRHNTNNIFARMDIILKSRKVDTLDDLISQYFSDMQLTQIIYTAFGINDITINVIISLAVLIMASDNDLKSLDCAGNTALIHIIGQFLGKSKDSRLSIIDIGILTDSELFTGLAEQVLNILYSRHESNLMKTDLCNILTQQLPVQICNLLKNPIEDQIEQFASNVRRTIVNYEYDVQAAAVVYIAKNAPSKDGIRVPNTLLEWLCIYACNMPIIVDSSYQESIVEIFNAAIFNEDVRTLINIEMAKLEHKKYNIIEADRIANNAIKFAEAETIVVVETKDALSIIESELKLAIAEENEIEAILIALLKSYEESKAKTVTIKRQFDISKADLDIAIKNAKIAEDAANDAIKNASILKRA